MSSPCRTVRGRFHVMERACCADANKSFYDVNNTLRDCIPAQNVLECAQMYKNKKVCRNRILQQCLFCAILKKADEKGQGDDYGAYY